MGLEKGISHGKEHREPYRKGKAIDSSCRNHKSCAWCRSNRLYQSEKALSRIKENERVYRKGVEE